MRTTLIAVDFSCATARTCTYGWRLENATYTHHMHISFEYTYLRSLAKLARPYVYMYVYDFHMYTSLGSPPEKKKLRQ